MTRSSKPKPMKVKKAGITHWRSGKPYEPSKPAYPGNKPNIKKGN